MKYLPVILMCVLNFSASVYAEELSDPIARTNRAIEDAIRQAKTDQQKNGTVKSFPVEISKSKAVDPIKLAEQYKQTDNSFKKAHDLLIFISTSMPRKTLEMIGQQANKAGAVVVVRGLRDRLSTPGALSNFMNYVEPLVSAGAEVQINPELFKRYDIQVVPTFVLAKQSEGCGNDQCPIDAYKLVGDVSLDYVLEEWVKKNSAVSSLAKIYLNRLK